MKINSILAALAFIVSGTALASPSYLYWKVDLDNEDNNPYEIEGFTYATVKAAGSASPLEIYNTAGQAIGSEVIGASDPATVAGPLYAALGEIVASSYLFELWTENENGVATKVGWASYSKSQVQNNIYTAMGQSGATPLSPAFVPEPSSALLFLIGFAGLALRRRKTLVAACLACFVSVGAFAAADNLIYAFQPDADDAYADGTPVLTGERYALVWLTEGSDGVEIAADGSVVDPSKGEIVLARPSLGRGEEFTFQVDAAKKDALVAQGGKWAVYLLDTRVYGAEGTVSLAETVDGKCASVNAAKLLDKSVKEVSALGTGVNATVRTAAAATTVATAVPADAPSPEITGITIENGEVHVKVRKTVPYLQYNLAAGSTPNEVSGKQAKTPCNGDAAGEIELVASATGSSAFFRVNRN